MNLFNLDWQRRIEEFNKEIERMLEDLRSKHEKQIVIVEISRKTYRTREKSRKNFTRVPNYWKCEKLSSS